MSTFFQKQQQVAALDPRLGSLMASAGLYNLRALIKGVRACKTLADERSLLQKESAAIRTSFKDDDAYMRYTNLSKLLYIHMLGYPAHFGQMECLKLVASPRFTDKRLGYLGIMLLLDENAQVLMLVTNGLKNDMNHSNMYIVGLALCTFANIASEEMSRDLCNEIEKLMGSSNSYIRKKATLCAMRIVRRVPDLVDHFRDRTLQLLSDKSHGVKLCALSLAIQICEMDSACVELFRRATTPLVATLRTLLSTSFSPEHDVAGITDPFLQTKILRFLRILGRDSVPVSDAINDILAQVATNTDGSKTVGNSILYECVLTILEIKSDSGLRVMAINILGKFLSNTDNNIRYVALNTLNKVVSIDTNAVQRHRAIILECLRDADISIRRRALELTYTLINESTVLALMEELLSFLHVADNEFKLGLTTRIAMAAERFAPSPRWHIDTMLEVLRLAGNYIRDDVLASFLRLVANTSDLHSYTVQKLYAALHNDLSQSAQTLAAVWATGEYGDILVDLGRITHDEVLDVSPKSVVDLLASLLESVYATESIREFVFTALAKLSTRMRDTSQQARIQSLLGEYTQSIHLETQKRALEYGALLQRKAICDGVLEAMPVPTMRPLVLETAPLAQPGTAAQDGASLLDMHTEPAQCPAAATAQTNTDLLADIFGGTAPSTAPAAAPAPARAPAPAPASASAPQGDLLGLLDASVPSRSDISTDMGALRLDEPAESEVYHADGLRLAMTASRSNAEASVQARFSGPDGLTIEGIALQAAVPKTQQLQMFSLSQSRVAPGEVATQGMRVTGLGPGPLRLRMRLAYSVNGELKRTQLDWIHS
ncbi:clathrin associated protein complex large subunit [Malassezia nana]|uniref:AP-1 complex subunit gamma n=1 Tax=Malassezia nana TaxID=180528 RepID=A0AAF0EJB4_9BASI|nr:clathrin associated protein complex large subunit [Malassezia nana]